MIWKKQHLNFHWKKLCFYLFLNRFCAIWHITYEIDSILWKLTIHEKIIDCSLFAENSFWLKIWTKKDKNIIFSQWKLRCCFFQIWCLGGRQGAWGPPILVWIKGMFFQNPKNLKLLTKIGHPQAPWRPPKYHI